MTELSKIDVELMGKRIPLQEAPIIDLAPFFEGSEEGKKETALALRNACINFGFMYVKNHGVPQELIDATYDRGKRFLAETTPEERAGITMAGNAHNRGYFQLGEESLDPEEQGDLKEGFNVGREISPDDPEFGLSLRGPNVWPESMPAFRDAMLTYYDAMKSLSEKIIHVFAMSLDMPENYFDGMVDTPLATMRFLHYPPQKGDIHKKQIGAGAHTDYGCFTLLSQDEAGGLQARNVASDWIEIPPVPGTFVMNIGDMFQHWTNGVYLSTLHRVINAGDKDRYSLPFFYDPNFDAVIEPLPSCVTPENPQAYPVTTGGLHLLEKLGATYQFEISKEGVPA